MDTTSNDIESWRIRRLAYRLWQQRGSPFGTPNNDWYRAERVLVRFSELPPPAEWTPPSEWAVPSEWALPLFAFGPEGWVSGS
jgi:hypothetical protein